MTQVKKEIIFIVGGLAVAFIELVLIVALLIYNNRVLPQPPETQPTTAATTAATAAPTEETLPPLPGNGLAPEDFVLNAQGFMTCTAQPYMIGIDVSSHQGDIDWKAVKEAGVQFVIIRIGGRGYGYEGNLFRDEKAQQNYEGAKANGLLVGAYIFSQALDEAEAREEARLVLEMTEGWELDLPVAFDWEYLHFEARTDEARKEDITDCALAFCDELEKNGLQPMLYTGVSARTLDLYRVQQYPMWLALYSDTMYYKNWMSFWQYSCTGTVPGIGTDVDLNILLPGEYFAPKEAATTEPTQ